MVDEHIKLSIVRRQMEGILTDPRWMRTRTLVIGGNKENGQALPPRYSDRLV